ncbi:MAG TPA: hypothetical protein VG269_01675 [Tepidisphaeraceae bacterium]|jgi:hypothetical protein|nr:hypothetical protein [Tepidisphaeraceae bacterium]
MTDLVIRLGAAIFWILLGISIAIIAGAIAHRRWLKRQGKCLYSGYDIRGSRWRCPECGKFIAFGR